MFGSMCNSFLQIHSSEEQLQRQGESWPGRPVDWLSIHVERHNVRQDSKRMIAELTPKDLHAEWLMGFSILQLATGQADIPANRLSIQAFNFELPHYMQIQRVSSAVNLSS